ncbi:hypothetical protein FRC11_002821 [Ceratobasidium sp. 423]|nr:hypothetical protein FRC11_002821 [Ceratobasidium sp. 423]
MDGPYGEDVCLSDIIIDVLPKLQSLVLAHFKLYGDELFQPDEDPDEIPDGVLPKIGLVRLVACSIGLKETRLMIRRYSVRRLVLWDCDFLLDDDWDESSYALDKDHPEKNETRREYFAGTGAVVDIVDAPLPECHISNDWEEWHPWKPWP